MKLAKTHLIITTIIILLTSITLSYAEWTVTFPNVSAEVYVYEADNRRAVYDSDTKATRTTSTADYTATVTGLDNYTLTYNFLGDPHDSTTNRYKIRHAPNSSSNRFFVQGHVDIDADQSFDGTQPSLSFDIVLEATVTNNDNTDDVKKAQITVSVNIVPEQDEEPVFFNNNSTDIQTTILYYTIDELNQLGEVGDEIYNITAKDRDNLGYNMEYFATTTSEHFNITGASPIDDFLGTNSDGVKITLKKAFDNTIPQHHSIKIKAVTLGERDDITGEPGPNGKSEITINIDLCKVELEDQALTHTIIGRFVHYIIPIHSKVTTVAEQISDEGTPITFKIIESSLDEYGLPHPYKFNNTSETRRTVNEFNKVGATIQPIHTADDAANGAKNYKFDRLVIRVTHTKSNEYIDIVLNKTAGDDPPTTTNHTHNAVTHTHDNYKEHTHDAITHEGNSHDGDHHDTADHTGIAKGHTHEAITHKHDNYKEHTHDAITHEGDTHTGDHHDTADHTGIGTEHTHTYTAHAHDNYVTHTHPELTHDGDTHTGNHHDTLDHSGVSERVLPPENHTHNAVTHTHDNYVEHTHPAITHGGVAHR